MRKVAYITHQDCLLHTCEGHPEHAGRLIALDKAIYDSGLIKKLTELEPEPATVEQLELNHDHDYVRTVMRLKPDGIRLLDADTYINEHSFRSALLAYGAGINAVDLILEGKFDRAFCAVRPPGHHALYDRAMGFCLFNNIAGAAHYALTRGLNRVAIVDFDVHHGNGTQWSFYDDDRVHFTSMHQWPFYPGSGGEHESGKGKGEGYTLNIPLEAGTVGPEAVNRLTNKFADAMSTFEPEIILISAGFDSHMDDPLASLQFCDQDFFEITRNICKISDEHSRGRVISFLEGGYELEALARSVCKHLEALLDE